MKTANAWRGTRAALLLVLVASSAAGEAFDFALVGDYPYTLRDQARMPHLLADLDRASSLSFVLHVGDLHSPRATECSESLFRERRDWFVGLGIPFVFTPGDNDWADCAERQLEFLELLRSVFFADPVRADGVDAFALRRQSESEAHPDLVENAIWERGGVVFATLHMIGTPLIPIPDETAATRLRLVEAAELWLEEAFRVAREHEARGVFLATQVNLWPISGGARMLDLLHPGLIDVDPLFEDFEAKLVARVREFGGPVVLAHGDTHSFRIDQPLHDDYLETLQTFTRVEGFGSPNGHWVRIRVDPERPEVFSFQQELVPENLHTLIPYEVRLHNDGEGRFAKLQIVARIIQAIPRVLAVVGLVALSFGSWKLLRGLWSRRSRAKNAETGAGRSSQTSEGGGRE